MIQPQAGLTKLIWGAGQKWFSCNISYISLILLKGLIIIILSTWNVFICIFSYKQSIWGVHSSAVTSCCFIGIDAAVMLADQVQEADQVCGGEQLNVSHSEGQHLAEWERQSPQSRSKSSLITPPLLLPPLQLLMDALQPQWHFTPFHPCPIMHLGIPWHLAAVF